MSTFWAKGTLFRKKWEKGLIRPSTRSFWAPFDQKMIKMIIFEKKCSEKPEGKTDFY